MLRSTLLIVATLAAACTLAEPGPTAVSVPPLRVAAVLPPPPPPTCDATAFLSKVLYYTDPSFRPVKNGPLPATSPLPRSPDYLSGLHDAFCAAPAGFQQALSRLDAIYINAAPCTVGPGCFQASWGWLRKYMGSTQRLVALSSSLWNTDYATYETLLTQAVLPQSDISYSNPQSCTIASGCSSVNNVATALLAALAHEVGHIRWFDWVNHSPANYCTPNFFSRSWNPPYHQPPAGPGGGYWRDLLTPGNRGYLRSHGEFLDKHLNPPQIDDIDSLTPGSVAQSQMIYQLLVPPMGGPSPWASLFAAMSPDEDFVETYKFKVLTDNVTSTASRHPLTSVWITVPNGLGAGSNGTVDIADAYHNGWRANLAAKVGCIMGY
jgi:hypothetical protein